jgi:putative NADH-flavin reductase
MSNLLGSKPVDGLRLSQATWSMSDNLPRKSSQVLASAEHYLSATGVLQDLEGECIAEIKSLVLQLDKALGTSQVLVSGALANLTLSKKSEILDKSSVNETFKDSLMKSPLTDKNFWSFSPKSPGRS